MKVDLVGISAVYIGFGLCEALEDLNCSALGWVGYVALVYQFGNIS